MATDSRPGTWPGWNVVALAVAVAAIVVGVPVLSPRPERGTPTTPATSTSPAPPTTRQTVTLEEFRVLTERIEPPATFDVTTPEGEIRVVVTTTTTSTTTTSTTTTEPSRPLPSAQGLMDQILSQSTTTIPEGDGGEQ